MKRKDLNYKWARENIYNKDRFLDNFIDDMLIKVNQMFHYENLPETVPKRILEKMLCEGGYCIFTKHNDKYVILQGGLGGELNEYYEYTECIVANPYLKLDKTFKLGEDCVLIRNDSRMKGLIPILSKYAVLCGDSEISINVLTNVLRTQFLISAGDNKTKESADAFIKKLTDGEFTSIAENTFLDGVKVHNIQGSANYIQQFVELNQYLKASAYNEIGLDANYNMKRERLTVNEVELNTSILIPLADDMLEQRRNAIEEINKKYGLNISVELSSVWKMQKETVDNATQTQDTETEIEKELDGNNTTVELETEKTPTEEKETVIEETPATEKLSDTETNETEKETETNNAETDTEKETETETNDTETETETETEKETEKETETETETKETEEKETEK